MAVDDAALDRLREDLLVAIRAAILASEHRIRGEITDTVSASAQRIRGEITDAGSASAQRIRGEITDAISASAQRIRGEITDAISASAQRIRGEITDAISASEHSIRGEIAEAVSASETRLETRLEARIESSAAETRRHIGVVAEDLTSKIALVAEGVITLTERLSAEMSEGFDILDRRLLRLETRLLSSPERG